MNGGYTSEQAAALALFQSQLRRSRRRRQAALGVSFLGAFVLLQHWVRHLGYDIPIGLSGRWQDLVIGYPAGGALLITGLVIRARRP